MNRFYLIAPLVLLGLFGGVYSQHARHAADDARAKAALVAEAKAAEDAKKAAAERKAREDADQRAAARLAEEQKKEEERRARWEADGVRLAADIAGYKTKIDALNAKIAEAQLRLEKQRSEEESRAQAAFERDRQIELARIAKRNAEIEIQRLTEIVARRAGTAFVADR